MTPKLTPGRRLENALNDLLRRASEAAGQTLSWDESDRQMIDRAAKAADQAARLRDMLDAEAAGQARPNVLTKLSAEIRQLDRLVVEFTRKVESGLDTLTTGKSARHVHAANTRWKAGSIRAAHRQ